MTTWDHKYCGGTFLLPDGISHKTQHIKGLLTYDIVQLHIDNLVWIQHEAWQLDFK